MTKEEFLLNTVEYYTTDTNRRSTTKNGGCFYNPAGVGKEGISDGCAIGRWMTPENKEIGDEQSSSAISSIIVSVPDIIPDWMREMGTAFLIDVQQLHDNDSNWYEKEGGLTDTGIDSLNYIVKYHEMNPETFKKYLSKQKAQA